MSLGDQQFKSNRTIIWAFQQERTRLENWNETEDMKWLLDTIQPVVVIPLALDYPDSDFIGDKDII